MGDRGRITPACAGKSRSGNELRVESRDHPRVCGEKTPLIKEADTVQGSPPRVRGKGSPRSPQKGKQGITPACAGKSRNSRLVSGLSGDHPRVCGEK